MMPRTMRPKRARCSIHGLPAMFTARPAWRIAPAAAAWGVRGLESDIVRAPSDHGGSGGRGRSGGDLRRYGLVHEEPRLAPSVDPDGEGKPQAAEQVGAHDVAEP